MIVLGEQGEQAVVGVLADTPFVGGRIVRRAPDIWKMRNNTVGSAVTCCSNQSAGRPSPTAMPRISASATGPIASSHARTASPSPPDGNRLAPWSGVPASDSGVVARVIEPDVQALLAVGSARCDLAANRKPSAPSRAGAMHRDEFFDRVGLLEELARETLHPGEQHRLDAVPNDAEEAQLAARSIDLQRDLGGTAGVVHEGRDVDQRQLVDRRCRRSVRPRSRLVAYVPATGVWLSWLERIHDTDEVGGSIPSTPTETSREVRQRWGTRRSPTLGPADGHHRGRGEAAGVDR